MMKPEAKNEYKKVSAEIFDPSRDARATSVFDTLSIADKIADPGETRAFTQMIKQSGIYAANNRSDKDIKASMRSIQ